MSRKKTTPTVATTEPDTTLNPDRAQVAAVADLPREPEEAQVPTSVPATPEAMDGLRATIAEQSARIATLEKVDHATRTYFNVRLDATQQEVEDAMVREYARVVALESLTPADLIAGYRAVASGQVKAAEWKGRRLVRLHGNPEPIAMYDHPEPPPGCMPSGFVAEVASGTTRIMSPPLKDEAEARAWCEARCGWTVVA